jgi:hypothetical protein
VATATTAIAPGPEGPYRSIAVADVAAAAARAQGKDCSVKGENLSGRGDPDACGPFPCDDGACVVRACAGKTTCYPGFCSQGYCLRAEPGGRRACQPFSEAQQGDAGVTSLSGCQCVAQSASMPRDRRACGSFPCGPDGCYVKACRRDSDCAYGLCSSYASGPHGYCVTDDPH